MSINTYNNLKNIIHKENAQLSINENGQLSHATLCEELGRGRSKIAFRLSNGRALILPNLHENTVEEISKVWKRIVQEEVAMSDLLTSLGLLSPMSKEVSIHIASDSTFPAYICETFDQLKTARNWSIFDRKSSNKWAKIDRLFEKAHLHDESKWDQLIMPMLDDIAKICRHNIPADGDSFNLAFVKKSQAEQSQYEVRYFGFDFSLRFSPRRIPKIDEPFDPSACIEKPRVLLENVLLPIFEREIPAYNFEERQKAEALEKKLTDKYLKIIKSKINP